MKDFLISPSRPKHDVKVLFYFVVVSNGDTNGQP